MSSTFSIRQLRLNNHIVEAMKLASEALGKTPGDMELMGETIRVFIVAGQPEAASSLYQVFAGASGSNNLEPQALVRLAMLLDRADLIENMTPPEGPSWLVELLIGGSDPVSSLEPQAMDISVVNGPAIFNIKGLCPHCDHSLAVQVKVSLLIHKTWICPACFGNVLLDHEGARKIMNTTFSEVLQESAAESDADLIDYLRPKLMGAEPMPDIALALGQEYHFLLNEIILADLTPEENTGADQS